MRLFQVDGVAQVAGAPATPGFDFQAHGYHPDATVQATLVDFACSPQPRSTEETGGGGQGEEGQDLQVSLLIK